MGEDDAFRYDLVMFDVDSKDLSIGMSCPPRDFVERSFLSLVREKCLQPRGKSIVFVVCVCSNKAVTLSQTHYICVVEEEKEQTVYIAAY